MMLNQQGIDNTEKKLEFLASFGKNITFSHAESSPGGSH
jgi:hypothetical protein